MGNCMHKEKSDKRVMRDRLLQENEGERIYFYDAEDVRERETGMDEMYDIDTWEIHGRTQTQDVSRFKETLVTSDRLSRMKSITSPAFSGESK
jgi:hypothetical protein